MRLIHYSGAPIKELREATYLQEQFHKPAGFWFSIDGEYGWKEWCTDENYRVEKIQYAHLVTLTPSANIKHIKTPQELDIFTDTYKVVEAHNFFEITPFIHGLNWPLICHYWDGIIISPYIDDRRLSPHTSWYYWWDCASGAIWNLDAIEKITPIDDGIKKS